jgi:hypothetical protein
MAKLVFNQDKKESDRDFEIALRFGTSAGEVIDVDCGAEVHRENLVAFLERVSWYLRTGQPVPTVLANIVADAFDSAATARSSRARIAAVTHGLSLTSGGKRPVHHPARICGTVQRFIQQNFSETSATKKAAKELGIAASTVRAYWKPYQEYMMDELGFLPWDDHRKDPDALD